MTDILFPPQRTSKEVQSNIGNLITLKGKQYNLGTCDVKIDRQNSLAANIDNEEFVFLNQDACLINLLYDYILKA